MTGEVFWQSWLAIGLLAGPIVLGFASFGYSIYLSRYLDDMMIALKNSRFIYIWGAGLRNSGRFVRFLLVARIAGMITMPRASIRIGELDPGDLENFPPHLKRLLQYQALMLVVGGIWLAVAYVLMMFE